MPIGVAGPRPVHRAPDGEDGAGRPLGPLWPDILSCRASRLLQHVRLPSARPESARPGAFRLRRSEEHTSELQSLMRISSAVFCLKKKKTTHHKMYITTTTQDDLAQQHTPN